VGGAHPTKLRERKINGEALMIAFSTTGKFVVQIIKIHCLEGFVIKKCSHTEARRHGEKEMDEPATAPR
jgi:hypothetical protein